MRRYFIQTTTQDGHYGERDITRDDAVAEINKAYGDGRGEMTVADMEASAAKRLGYGYELAYGPTCIVELWVIGS